MSNDDRRTMEELWAAGVCECGQALDTHPPLAQPLPMDHGRPCARPANLGWGYNARGEPLRARPAGRGRGVSAMIASNAVRHTRRARVVA